MHKPLYEDPVVAEIHAIRAKMLADCGGDHDKLMREVGERQRASGRKIIKAPFRTRSAEQSVGPHDE
ncbi:MAG: hypothetical protein IID44_24040 [Planctomycetes bacterium]|nr:hypothetical protein [Planctomycetota bacterium]